MKPELEDTQAAPKSPSDPARTATLAGAPVIPGEELPPGIRLGHFRIEKKLGAGGMGEVYLATDLALDRPVAIKVLPANKTSGAARERLIREARAQARIQHPNVAHIYFIGEDAGRLYFAMEYIAGETLADKVSRKRFSVEEALHAVHGAAIGLREAQRSGFMHRDIKPSNLMLDRGNVKVLDFGLAAAAPGDIGDGPVAQTSLAGTPLYMAPEQATSQEIDFRADIYALGATLFHLVSGQPPFKADTVAGLITMHATAPRPQLPRGSHPRTAIVAIDMLIARMMATDPKERFASYDELIHAIEIASLQHTRPAGFWVRVIATLIDLGLVTLVTVLARQALRQGDGDNGTITMMVYGPYAALALGRFGTTIGKALFELEVVSLSTGQRVTWGQALVRELLIVAAPVAFGAAELIGKAVSLDKTVTNILDIAGVAAMVVMVIMLFHAAWRVPSKRAPWDRASGTLVRYRKSRAAPAG